MRFAPRMLLQGIAYKLEIEGWQIWNKDIVYKLEIEGWQMWIYDSAKGRIVFDSSSTTIRPSSSMGIAYKLASKRNLKTPVKTRTLHLSEPYDSRSTTHTAMQPRKV
jgi:hypothetical protein